MGLSPSYGYEDATLLVVMFRPFWEPDGALDASITNVLIPELNRAGYGTGQIRITSLIKHVQGPHFYKEPNHFECHLLETIKEMNSYEKVLLLGSDMPRIFVGEHLTDYSSILGIPMTETKYFRDKILLFGPSLDEAVSTGIGELRDVIELRKAI
jgi:hypothetical protein